MKRPFFDLEVGGKTYSFKLTVKGIMGIEAKMNQSFGLSMAENIAPSISFIAIVMDAAAKEKHPEFTVQTACDLIEELIDEGNTYTELGEILSKIVETSGFFKKKADQTEAE